MPSHAKRKKRRMIVERNSKISRTTTQDDSLPHQEDLRSDREALVSTVNQPHSLAEETGLLKADHQPIIEISAEADATPSPIEPSVEKQHPLVDKVLKVQRSLASCMGQLHRESEDVRKLVLRRESKIQRRDWLQDVFFSFLEDAIIEFQALHASQEVTPTLALFHELYGLPCHRAKPTDRPLLEAMIPPDGVMAPLTPSPFVEQGDVRVASPTVSQEELCFPSISSEKPLIGLSSSSSKGSIRSLPFVREALAKTPSPPHFNTVPQSTPVSNRFSGQKPRITAFMRSPKTSKPTTKFAESPVKANSVVSPVKQANIPDNSTVVSSPVEESKPVFPKLIRTVSQPQTPVTHQIQDPPITLVRRALALIPQLFAAFLRCFGIGLGSERGMFRTPLLRIIMHANATVGIFATPFRVALRKDCTMRTGYRLWPRLPL